ncbi:MAG: DUF1705 domain-containing protein, partial [Pseudomonas caspiana]
MFKIKPLRPEVATLLASAFLLLGFNSTLWQHLVSITDHNAMLRLAFGIMLFGVFNITLTLLAFRKTLKPLLIALFMISAGVAYFMSRYGVLIDAGMLRNFAETNATEVWDLLSPKLFVYILLLGLLPSFLLWKTPINHRPMPRELISKTLVSIG